MKERYIINIGDRFNRLVVIAESEKDKYGHKRYLCKCDCSPDKTVIVLKSQLTSGKTGSCGCYQRDMARISQTKHGLHGTKLYNVWKEMIKRCCNNNSKSFPNYGGRGIAVCTEWKEDFQAFYDWSIKNGYNEGLTIERINNNGNYEPDNCCWIEKKKQSINKRNNIFIKHDGKVLTVSQWSQITGINDKKIRQRIRKLGWDEEKSITIP